MAAKKKKAPPPAKRTFAETLFETHLRQLKGVVDERGARGLKSLYAEARADLYDRLSSVGTGSKTATGTELRALIGQTEGALTLFGRNLNRHLRDVGSTATQLGATHAVDEYKRLEKHFKGTTPVLDLERASVFKGILADVDSSLLRRHQAVSQTWTLSAINAIEQRLAVGSMTGKPLEALVRDVMGKSGIVEQERWKAERIVRTELAYAHGTAKFRAMQEAKNEGGPTHKRLIATFDDRTGDDSFLQHGQTVPLESPFTWKHQVRGKWVVTPYMYPPNRPNDREVVVPWDPSWEETDIDRPLTRSELKAAAPTRWRKRVGVTIPPGHRPGRTYR